MSWASSASDCRQTPSYCGSLVPYRPSGSFLGRRTPRRRTRRGQRPRPAPPRPPAPWRRGAPGRRRNASRKPGEPWGPSGRCLSGRVAAMLRSRARPAARAPIRESAAVAPGSAPYTSTVPRTGRPHGWAVPVARALVVPLGCSGSSGPHRAGARCGRAVLTVAGQRRISTGFPRSGTDEVVPHTLTGARPAIRSPVRAGTGPGPDRTWAGRGPGADRVRIGRGQGADRARTGRAAAHTAWYRTGEDPGTRSARPCRTRRRRWASASETAMLREA